MSSGVAAAPLLNGNGDMSSETRRYADFYEKLFQLQDEVFAGKHPRIKLPDSVLEQVAPRPVQNIPSSSYRPATNGTANGATSSLHTPLHPDTPSYFYQPTAPFVSQPPNGQRPFSAKPSSSIDPVLLTKSDDLVRAELQLKRQRIERAIKDHVDKRGQSRDSDLALATEARFDVDELLAKALELVKPISGLHTNANRNSDGSDSFDENSYYSSQANSSSPEDVETQNVDSADAAGVVISQGRVQNNETSASKEKKLGNQPFTNLQDEDQYEPADDLHFYTTAPEVSRDEREESEYSPPPAADAFTTDPQAEGSHRTECNRLQGQSGGVEQSGGINGYGYNRPPSPTSPAVPVIRNHIRSPVAPQPARVSPLAFTKVPKIDQGRRNGQQENRRGYASPRPDDNRSNDHASSSRADHASPRTSRRQSPAAPQQSIRNPRKRRRDPENSEKRGRAGNKRVARSPEPYIKEEPTSPPPFASLSDPQPNRQRVIRQLPEDVEIVSAREARAQPVYYREQEPLPRAYRHIEEPIAPTVVRVPSRTAHRRLERDDQDLRRVASLQYARRPYSPTVPEPILYSPSDNRHVRAASYAFADRPAPQPIYREGSVHPSAAPRYVRERSRSPVHVAEQYLPRAHTPVAMGPPPRQVVVDQYGNKYYAAPTAMELRESVAPPSRRVDVEPYYERAITREPAVHAPARVVDPYEEEEALQRMPPPLARRYVEQPDVEVVEPRSYRQREYSLRPAEAEYAPIREVVERRPLVHYEEMAPPREYVTRSFSVRPEVVRREAPNEYITTRHESVQPGYVRRADPPVQRYQEVSVQGDPYVPLDDRRYAYAPVPQQRRFVDDGLERPIEVAQDPYGGEMRRVSYRY